MVSFDILKFTSPTQLRVKASVIYPGTYLSVIYITTEEYTDEDGPDEHNTVYKYSFPSNTESVDKVIDLSDFLECETKSHIFFVSFRWTGVPSVDPPCGVDKVYITKGVVYGNDIYNKAVSLIKCQKGCGCSSNECEVSPKFANFALEYFKMQTCLGLGKNTEAYESFNRLLGYNIESKEIYTSNCGCNDN